MKTEQKTKNKYISLLIYGKGGVGKSIFANTFPKCLYFDFDNGNNLYEEHFPDNKYLRGDKLFSYLSGAIQQIKEGKFEYETIVIDSLTGVEALAINNFKKITPDNFGDSLYKNTTSKLSYTDWGNISGSTMALFTFLRTLPVNVVIITQITSKEDEGVVTHVPNLIGKGENEAIHFPDYVGYMYKKDNARYITFSSTEFDKFVAKGRFISGDQAPIKNPNYEKLMKLVNNNKFNLSFEE